MRSELKHSVSREFYIYLLVLLAVIIILCIAQWTGFGLFVAISVLIILTFRLARGLLLMSRLASGPVLAEEKKILVVPGGNFHIALQKMDLNVWLSISGPIGRVKGSVECVTDNGSKVQHFYIEDYKRTSRSGQGSIIRMFSLNNAAETSVANFLNIKLDFHPRSEDQSENYSITVLATLQQRQN